jgi:aminoglycoside phosphotransferase (APT) family kinase protein
VGIGARRIGRSASAAGGQDPVVALRQLLNPTRRSWLPGLPRRRLALAAVWPDGRGFCARLESPRRPGAPVLWVRWRDGLEVWPFPEDPALPALEELVDRGYALLGHRLARRAALLAPDGSHVIYLRPARAAAATFERLRAVHGRLRGRVPVAELGPEEPERHGLRAEYVRGDAAEGAGAEQRDGADATRLGAPPDGAAAARWSRLGEILARAHAAEPPPGLPPRGPAAALEAAVRQVGLAVHSGDGFTEWLERRFERWKLLGRPAGAPGAALVHGDLHPGQIVWRGAPVILDWERAGAGDPEEDLGNLAAHLHWRSGPGAAHWFAGLRASYQACGGRLSQPLFEHYARLALVRVLAVHALRAADRPRIQAGQSRWADWPETVARW